jgi:hypothetical protein
MLYHDIRLAIIAGRFVMFSPREWTLFASLVSTDAPILRDPANTVVMCRLRRKLANVGLAQLVETIRTQGYVLRPGAVASLDPWPPRHADREPIGEVELAA